MKSDGRPLLTYTFLTVTRLTIMLAHVFLSSWLLVAALLMSTTHVVQAMDEKIAVAQQLEVGIDGMVKHGNSDGIVSSQQSEHLAPDTIQEDKGYDEKDIPIPHINRESEQVAELDDDDDEPGYLDDEYPDCQDLEKDCSQWVSDGECDAVDGNPEFMYTTCPRSCKICGKGDIEDLLERAMILQNDDLAISGWGKEQIVDANNEKGMKILLDDIKRYMLEEVNVEEKYQSFKKKCQNRHEKCAFWAFEGEVRLTLLHISIYPLWIICIRLT